ncbi:TPA: hypothetical protein DEP34_02335 [Candidatus Uhrbacteria bacterium]|uniref:Uncharacterized protein n=2 Tax=Candidatus Uhriibacteriota TaxID=1752732 RepID=A0A0G1Q7X2_9BACT|nr:MAG: hypothetical protein UX45_C0008G0027 [Candidatus Uhrbacteria bacterium GW2011_GWF2_46_218]KKU41131.1 MAG: hypothetical protein UX57_C0006G0041 [Candidatus Uhrbacteria bacterium GW2011_GWE2_46_68]HBK34312.1 hypothetical protein [Candidatus Uhrbacteria bacterium]HCB19201.1 hypothetical protein [Candidatus Uhrbacteria bacterium]
MASAKQQRVNFSDFVFALNSYVRIGESGEIVDSRSALVTNLLDLVARSGADILSLYEAEDIAAMVSGHIKYDKKAADLVPTTTMVDGREFPTPGSQEILKALGELKPMRSKVLALLTQASRDHQMSHKLTLSES